MLLESLIIASERAANIARKCREDEHLFKLLIEEKNEDEANPRFVQDFKTLADVLIQETLRHDIGKQYPEMKENIKGEESNVFCNALGESITVEKLESSSETANLLCKVLNEDAEAARLLAEEVHRELTLEDINTPRPEFDIEFDYSQLGIWIDPIDSTAEYINGTNNEDCKNPQDNEKVLKIATNGLKCVTVLIGVYNLETGVPIMGIINQPFYSKNSQRWRGMCYWGISSDKIKCSSINSPKTSPTDSPNSPENSTNENNTNIICLSGSEDQKIKNKLISAGFELIEAAGAGYKMLVTVLNLADIYLLSKSSTFKWDSCGPHALLKSLGGDIVTYEEAVRNNEFVSVNYKIDSDGSDGMSISKINSCCNKGGVVAFRNRDVMNRIVVLLREEGEGTDGNDGRDEAAGCDGFEDDV